MASDLAHNDLRTYATLLDRVLLLQVEVQVESTVLFKTVYEIAPPEALPAPDEMPPLIEAEDAEFVEITPPAS